MARQLCPSLVIASAHYDAYLHISRLARQLYEDYSDRVEPYGLDECWLDVTGSRQLFGDGETIAHSIRQRVKEELGVTVSIGVSFNKVFAKLGSDYKKPDAVTSIPFDSWREIVWPLPVSDLFYAGPTAVKVLERHTIRTIGGLAAVDPCLVHSWLGKCGQMLLAYARGLDTAVVSPTGVMSPLKSIGNGTTLPRDLSDGDELRIFLYILCESVAERLRRQGLQCRTVQLTLRWNHLTQTERQTGLETPTSNAQAIFEAAYGLYRLHAAGKMVRAVGVRVSGLDHWAHQQLSLLPDIQRTQRLDRLDKATDAIRRRFGRDSIRRGLMLLDPAAAAFNPQTDHPAIPPGGMR